MNRTLKEATVRRYHYDSHDQLRDHLATFLAAYNFVKRLKTLRGLTPHESAADVRRDKAALSSGCKPHPTNLLPPEATGAVMEVTKWLKPSDSVPRIGGSASVQAATQVNAVQTSKRSCAGRPGRRTGEG
jgi:hypothetical protein